MNSEDADLALCGSLVLCLDDQDSQHSDAAVVIKSERIVAIGDKEELLSRYRVKKIIDTPHGLIMPGLINSHTHAAMSLFRGVADDLPLMTWLNEHIFPLEAKLTKEMVYYSTLLSVAEMIRGGTTTFCDMYLFSEQVAQAAADAGMRAWVGEGFFDFPSPSYGELKNGFTLLDQMLEKWQDHELVGMTINPHSTYTCSPELLTRLHRIAREKGLIYHIHLAENNEEIATCQEKYGKHPVRHLDELGLMDELTLAIHSVCLGPEEIARFARRGASIAHCPESNMKLASGIAPLPELLTAGVNVALGTDGAASNNNTDMFSEMDCAAKLHKVSKLDPSVADAKSILRMATISGARALQADKQIGSLAPGKKADCIVLDMRQPHLTPMYNPISQLVYSANGADVLHSVINGKLVMENRKLLSIEIEPLLDRIERMAKDISGR